MSDAPADRAVTAELASAQHVAGHVFAGLAPGVNTNADHGDEIEGEGDKFTGLHAISVALLWWQETPE